MPREKLPTEMTTFETMGNKLLGNVIDDDEGSQKKTGKLVAI